jgi:hypothetical protein
MSTPSTPQDFKKKRAIGVMLELPSGASIKVKSVDLVSLVVSGKIPNSLLATVQGHLEGVDPEATVSEATKMAEKMDPEELAEVFSVMDTLVMAIAMEPKIHPVPEDEGQRSDDLLYIDEVDGEDKLFMFNWSQEGLANMKRFPGGPASGLASMEKSGSAEQLTIEDSGIPVS